MKTKNKIVNMTFHNVQTDKTYTRKNEKHCKTDTDFLHGIIDFNRANVDILQITKVTTKTGKIIFDGFPN